MNLELISPQKVYFSGEVSLVSLPGKSGRFTVLDNHAPIISKLDKGVLKFRTNQNDSEVMVGNGFVEVNKNRVIVCVEEIYNA